MNYRRWFHGTLLGIFGVTFLLTGVAWLVDPIEIWEAPVIRGFNHIKPHQASFLDVFKPFQVHRHKPEVVYIGTSRVYVGFRPEESAYNMGTSDLTLPDMKEYLRFIYSQQVPKRIYIGLDLFQFSHEYMVKQRNGFSKERMEKLGKGMICSIWEAVETNFGLLRYLEETVSSSWKKRNEEQEWERGWDVKRGKRMHINEPKYYHVLHSYHEIYTNFVYDSESIVCLQKILDEAASHNVEVVLFFNPVSIDLLALQSICGREQIFRDIKTEVATLYPVFDFAWTSSWALDRNGVWMDGSHYHYLIGEQMKATITEYVDSESCRMLTPKTVKKHLQEEAALYEHWASEHSDYIQALAEAAPQKIPIGILKQYLGF